jgi:tyrosine-protein kinase Etk/Wzc
MATKKTEEKDIFELAQNLLKNWYIVLPCVLFAAAVGVFVAMWIRPVYQVDALLQIETKNGKGPSMMGDMAALFATTSPAETEIELIKSRRVLGSTVEAKRLQYYAIPKGKWDRLLHREGRMELMNFDVPWNCVPLEDQEKPWLAKVLDSTSFVLYDHNNKSVMEGVVGQTYHFLYACDTATFGIYRM